LLKLNFIAQVCCVLEIFHAVYQLCPKVPSRGLTLLEDTVFQEISADTIFRVFHTVD